VSKTEFTAEEFESLGEGSIWPRFLLFPALAIVGYVGFVSGLGGDSLIVKIAWSLFLGGCWACVAGSFHESVHQTIGRWRTANIWFGRIVGTLLGIPYSAYRETHIRHHAYLNTTEDFELWPYSKPGKSLAFRRAFVVLELLGATLLEPIIYGRIFFVKDSPLNAQARKTIAWEYMGMAAFWGAVTLTIVALSVTGTVDIRRFDLMWLLPMQIAAAINTLRKFVEHLGMESYEPFLGTRTIVGNNPITRLCSYFNFDLDVHGPHHRFPKAPSFELESRLLDYQRKNPTAAVPVFTTYLAALWNTLPCLWRNPGVGENAVSEYRLGNVHKQIQLLPPGIDNFTSEVTASDNIEIGKAA
jgi:fatty acid desaturase